MRYEPLSAQDSSFVMFDGWSGHLAVSAVAIFDAGPVSDRAGRLDVSRIRDFIGSRLHLLPHYRQRLALDSLQRRPIWVDDADFDLAHHVRHVALPTPGGTPQLKELAGRLISQPLDPQRPLWELWCVEGLEGGGFAIVAKVHHCMVDGVSGVGVVRALLSPSPDPEFAPGPRWRPRPAPGLLDFLAGSATGGIGLSLDALRAAGSALLHPVESVTSAWDTASAGVETLGAGLRPPPDTPLNGPIGTQRRMEWHALDLAELRDLKKRLDGTLNDVVLALVAGALRRFLLRRRFRTRGLDLRVIVPVDTRAGPVDLRVGNQVSAWFLSMPVGESNARRRFDRIRTQTRRLRRRRAERGVDAFLRFADWSGSSRLPHWGVGLVNWLRPYNLIVTNVHGPQTQLYMLGAPMRAFYPVVPLFRNQGLSVAVMSYLGRVCFGLLGDWDRMRDLPQFSTSIDAAFEELRRAAERPETRSGRRSARAPGRRAKAASGPRPPARTPPQPG